MPATASQCRPSSRMALTKGVATGLGGSVVSRPIVVVSVAISELEIDERAAFGREKAEVENHEHGYPDAHRAGVENCFKARLEQELVQPDQRDQQQHEPGHL